MLNLGPGYGKVKVGDLSLEEATEAVTKQLEADPARIRKSRSRLNESGGQQQIAGEHLVGPDGTVNLGTYGRVYVAGLTIARGQAGHRRASETVSGSAAGVGRRVRLQQQGVLRDHRRGRLRRQHPAVPGHRQRNGAGRDQPGATA